MIKHLVIVYLIMRNQIPLAIASIVWLMVVLHASLHLTCVVYVWILQLKSLMDYASVPKGRRWILLESARLVMLIIVRSVWMETHLNAKNAIIHTCWIITTFVSVLKERESTILENVCLALIIVWTAIHLQMVPRFVLNAIKFPY